MLAFSAAWLTIADQRQGKRKAEITSKKSLLAALEIELTAMKPWTGEYQSDYDYSKDGAVFLRWHTPFYAPIYPLVHNTVAAAATAGISNGFSFELVKALVELEYQLNIFEGARRKIEDITNNNLEVCESLSSKLIRSNPQPNTTNIPTNLVGSETPTMSRIFELHRYLHVECIGNSKNGPNLHQAYLKATSLLSKEKQIENDQSVSSLENAGHWLAIIFFLVGLFIALSAFFSFIIPLTPV